MFSCGQSPVFKQGVFHTFLSGTSSACLFHVAVLIVATASGADKVYLRTRKDNSFWSVLGSIPVIGFMMNQQLAHAEGYRQAHW